MPAICQRNSVNYLHWQVNRRFTDLPAESRYASKDWRWRVSTDYNDHGQLMGHQFRISRESRLRNGSYEYGQININSAGYDDLLTRGNGVLWLPPNFNSYFDYERPRIGRWGYEVEARTCSAAGCRATTASATGSTSSRSYFISDAFNLYVGVLNTAYTPDWLVWQFDNLIGSFDRARNRSQCRIQLEHRQPARAAAQAPGHRAERPTAPGVSRGRWCAPFPATSRWMISAWRISACSCATATSSGRSHISMSSTAAADIARNTLADDTGSLVRDSFELRDDEQLLVKFSYRFEN